MQEYFKAGTVALLFLLTIVAIPQAYAQTVHGQVSVMSGPGKTDVQTFIVLPLDDGGTFTFTNLAFFQRFHDEEDRPFDEIGVQGALYWNITQSLAVGPGMYYNSPKGLMPRMLLQTFHSIGPVTLITNPALYHHEDGYWGGELYAQATLIQKLKQGAPWLLFVQANMLTTLDRFEDHGRSFLQLRAGPRFDGGIQFGLAWDKDWYGPAKISRSSVGLFVEQWF